MKSHKTLAFSSLLGTLLAIAIFGILIDRLRHKCSGGNTIYTSPTAAPLQKCGSIGVMRTMATTTHLESKG